MMMKLLKNKIVACTLVGVLSVSATLAVSYAWFTARYNIEQTFKLGSLELGYSFTELDDFLYEPGLTASSKGLVKNTGNLAATVALDSEVTAKFPQGDGQYHPIPDGVTKHLMQAENYDIEWDSEGNVLSAWMYDTQHPGNLYLIMAPGAQVAMDVATELLGEMGNDYQDARLKVDYEIIATQVIPGAVEETFSLDYNDLDFYFGPVTGRSNVSNSRTAEAHRQIMAWFERGER